MNSLWTIIGVSDVPASFAWYQSLLGLRKTAPAHPEFGQILDTDLTVLLCLHAWESHGHPSLMSPVPRPGNGLLLFFRVGKFAACLEAAQSLVPQLDETPHLNPRTGTLEFALRDPDGYHVTISAQNRRLPRRRGNEE